MTGLGTILNSAGIVFGGIVGRFAGKFLKPQQRDALNKACGGAFIPDRLDSDFLHRAEPDRREEDSGGQHAAGGVFGHGGGVSSLEFLKAAAGISK